MELWKARLGSFNTRQVAVDVAAGGARLVAVNGAAVGAPLDAVD
jgi:hypothetical protein